MWVKGTRIVGGLRMPAGTFPTPFYETQPLVNFPSSLLYLTHDTLGASILDFRDTVSLALRKTESARSQAPHSQVQQSRQPPSGRSGWTKQIGSFYSNGKTSGTLRIPW